jgi:RND superfamily putative drug exporter
MGFGLAIAVALDATIVRSVLVPASMKLLGDRDWYLPIWLEWLPKIDIKSITTPEKATETERELVAAR